ncbi:carbohydrate binding protein with CBM9 domain [Pasteurella langaaensis DSM 22999]|uniref:Carbohydrate binding protein with CBM9 domain n=1 Tax=Alitibacter langaaensis DSM 22999 TaxID=1122935 RepID=A0A2U0TD56_9PAST|nr:carbohydrate-binding family 9-like protein [Pasteurella langaaensis]PVX41546.1 carbohydrate binding protein with CBM9 domain [Pasteurella langaaensis DSM 22999]
MKKLLIATVLATAFSMNAFADNGTKTYQVAYESQAPVLDGKLDDAVWGKVKAVTDFTNPWEQTKMPKTEFKAFHDDQNFYFSFDVEDPNIVVYDTVDHEWMVAREDRVELFMAPGEIDKPLADGKYPKYIALEMDYKGRTLSMIRDVAKNINREWDPKTLETVGVRTEKGYTLEGKIALSELKEHNLIQGNKIRAGAYRAEFSIVEGKEQAKWITWVDPKTEKPNFHINSSFGEFVLEPKK